MDDDKNNSSPTNESLNEHSKDIEMKQDAHGNNDTIEMENKTTENIDEQMNVEGTPSTPVEKTSIPDMARYTPAVVKVRQTRQMFHVQSPSDAIMSPCTKKLNTGVQMIRRPTSSNPASVLRFKQQNAIKLNLDADNVEPDEETMNVNPNNDK